MAVGGCARPPVRCSQAAPKSSAASDTSGRDALSYLPKTDQKKWRGKFQRAYQEPTYEAAKERLTGLRAELEQINRKAANSLMEGLEETLTLHRLGLFEELGRSLKNLGCIENLNEKVEGYTDNVKPSATRLSATGGWPFRF